MEQSFQSLLLAGKYGVADGNFPPVATSDDIYNHIQMSYLTRSYEKSVLSSLIYPYGLSSLDVFNRNINQSAMNCESSNEYNKWRCVQMEEKLKRLKTEPSTEAFTFIPTNALFNQLPELRSMEQVNQNKRCMKQKYSPVETTYGNQHLLEPTVTNFPVTANYFTPAKLPVSSPSPAKLSAREQATIRRRTLSDKTRCLQNLLPVEKKMDMATIYEETYKYINFLKAQISVLESMPVSSTSSLNFRSENPRYGNLYGGLGKLNRQQLLEILINSPAAQSILYSKGCCVYSLEQLMLFNDIAGKSFFISDC